MSWFISGLSKSDLMPAPPCGFAFGHRSVAKPRLSQRFSHHWETLVWLLDILRFDLSQTPDELSAAFAWNDCRLLKVSESSEGEERLFNPSSLWARQWAMRQALWSYNWLPGSFTSWIILLLNILAFSLSCLDLHLLPVCFSAEYRHPKLLVQLERWNGFLRPRPLLLSHRVRLQRFITGQSQTQLWASLWNCRVSMKLKCWFNLTINGCIQI